MSAAEVEKSREAYRQINGSFLLRAEEYGGAKFHRAKPPLPPGTKTKMDLAKRPYQCPAAYGQPLAKG